MALDLKAEAEDIVRRMRALGQTVCKLKVSAYTDGKPMALCMTLAPLPKDDETEQRPVETAGERVTQLLGLRPRQAERKE